MPYQLLTNGDVPDEDYFNLSLMKQTIISCTSGTRPSSPPDGMMIYETDTRLYRAYNSSDAAWNFIATNRKLWARKSSDQSKTTNTSVAADTELLVTGLPSGQFYFLRGIIGYSADTAADMKGGLYGPSGGSFRGTYRSPAQTVTATSGIIAFDFADFGAGFVFGGAGGGVNVGADFDGILYSGVGGTVGFQWAQNASSATATIVLTSSYIRLTPLG